MKQHFIIKNNQKHLLLFFAGWGMDETPFLQIHPTVFLQITQYFMPHFLMHIHLNSLPFSKSSI